MKLALYPLFELAVCTAGYFLSAHQVAIAQITPDGTIDTQVIQNGDVAEITGGESRGNNLFHSFQDFSIPTGNEAFFNNAFSVSNIFSRVTGGNISNIDGAIRANGDANLFLINPAGIIFGENSRLDIGGSFYGSTASSILFDEGEFSAVDNLNAPILTVNAPIGLGFRDNPGDIVNRSIARNNFETVGLEVIPSNSLAFIGGNLNFEGGNLTTRGGNIHLGGVSEAGNVGINEDGSLNFPTDLAKANIALTDSADVDVRGIGGAITVNAQNLNLTAGELDNSLLRAGIRLGSISAEAQAGNITIDVTNNITLNGGRILNRVNLGAIGNSGDIIVRTNSLDLSNGGDIDASVFGFGNAGSVDVTATGDIVADGENIGVFPSGITSFVVSNTEGDAGEVTVSANNLTLTNGARIDASTFGRGNAGSVDVNVTGDIIADGKDSLGFPSGIASLVFSTAVGDAGGVNVSANNLTLTSGARIDASTFGTGNAGSIDVNVMGDINIDGENAGSFPTDIVNLPIDIIFPTGITSLVLSNAEGDAGGVNVSANNLTLTNGGRIDTSVFDNGNAGTININVSDDILITGISTDGLSSAINNQIGTNASGNTRGIFITSNTLTLENSGQISTSILGEGNIEAIDIITNEEISIDGEDSGIFANVGEDGVGNSGDINLATRSLFLTDDGEINNSIQGQGNAGGINITAEEVSLVNGEISTEVDEDAVGNAGNLTFDVLRLSIIDEAELNSSTSGQGDGGTVTIQANEVSLVDGEISTSVESDATGNGGSININATDFVEISGVNLDASLTGLFANSEISAVGNPGSITVDTNRLNIDRSTIQANNLGDRNSQGTGNNSAFETNIFLRSNNLFLNNNASVSAITESGTGGNANIIVEEQIQLRNNSNITAGSFGFANGGNVTIDAQFIVGFPSQTSGNGNDIIAVAELGSGGNINILVDRVFGIKEGAAFFNNNRNDFDASSALSIEEGIVVNILDSVALPPTNLIDSQQTTAQACQANREKVANSGLTIEGKGGILPEPGLPLNSLNVSVSEEAKTSSILQPIETSKGKVQPARGVKVNEDGKIMLTAYRTNNSGARISQHNINCRS